MDVSGNGSTKQPFGVYTKTTVQSSVIRWIVYARIRNRQCKDVVFVGEDFVQVKEIGSEGQLQHIAAKSNFDARIRAANSFDNEGDERDGDFLVKLERDRKGAEPSSSPPQLLVLTLDSNDLVFLYLRTIDQEVPRFVQQTCPMPSFDRILYQPGEHLAVDPRSRAVAVAANEREVIIYSAKPQKQIRYELMVQSRDWCPISSQRPLQVDGIIHHMDFLFPTTNDEDNVILLLVVTDQRRSKLVRVDWHFSSGPSHAEIHPGQPLGSYRKIPNLLIPLRGSAFLLVTGNEITRYKDILSGSATDLELPSPSERPTYPGTSPYPPVWANWSRPRRSPAAVREKDSIYLVREDGLVYLFEIYDYNIVQTSDAGNLRCHVGSAFASLGDDGGPDVLAVAGETSSGTVVSIGLWPTTRPPEELSREDSMSFEPVQILTNWASVTELVSCGRSMSTRSTNASSDSLYVTSGRQPFGCVTELRKGLETRLSVIAPVEFLRNITDAWALPETDTGSILLVLSLPLETKLINIQSDLSDINEIDEASAFDTVHRTLAAGMTLDSQLVQVTNRGICSSSSLHANFEDTVRKVVGEDEPILSAAVVSDASVVVTAERHNTGFNMSYYCLPNLDGDPHIEKQSEVALDSEPLCVAAMTCQDGIMALTATGSGKIISTRFNSNGLAAATCEVQAPTEADGHAVCDSLVILRPPETKDASLNLLAVCGFRDGKIATFQINPASPAIVYERVVVELGFSPVKLAQLPLDHSSAIALTGPHTCLLHWDGASSQSLQIDNLWVVDKHQPDYKQGQVVAVTQMPSASYLACSAAAKALVMVSGGELLVSNIERIPTTVPRQLPVNGTPNRLIHSDSLRSLVCAGLRTDVRHLPSRPHSAPEERRQIWPVIDFIPDRGGKTFTHAMQPGERVNALLEWTFRQGGEKTYTHILVGGSYIRHNGSRRGKVTFLQSKSSKNWEIIDITERSREIFDEDVYALALYDDVTYIACAGENIHMKRFSLDDKKWHELCPPFKVASAGVHITVNMDHSGGRLIVVSTMRDSLIVLRLSESVSAELSASDFDLQPIFMGPRAEALMNHFILSPASAPYISNDIDIFALITTKFGRLLGMVCSKHETSTRSHPGQLVFEAQLPRSLTRLAKTHPPRRKGNPPAGVVQEYITGCAADGALVGIVLLESHLWRRLSWLQRLIEWSEELSPHSFASPAYNAGSVDSVGHKDRALPIGFSGSVADAAMLHTNNSNLQDFHVDGDVLARVLDVDGKEAVKQVLRDLALKDDATGSWVRAHLEEEIGALDELLDVVRRLDAWM